MTAPSACPECLRRSWLLARLSPYIERHVLTESGACLHDLLALPSEELARQVAPKVAAQVTAQIAAIPEQRLSEEIDLADCWAICRHSDHFPASLRALDDAPWTLFGRGDYELLAGHVPQRTVAIVGARRATCYGREVSRELGRHLADKGIVVVSGLSFGIDGCAHRGALDGGHTIAVLPTGPDVAYPASHRSIWRRITETDLVLSELPPGSTPWRWTFPARTRIVAGLAGMAVIVEAAEISGALVAAERAAEVGHLVGAVPGPITSRSSAGTNSLLAGGASVVRSSQDVLDALDEAEND